MIVKTGAFGLCTCVSGETTWVHSAHTCCNESSGLLDGCAKLVRLSYETTSSVQAGVTSFPMTRGR
jgi:hypothetical protein